MSRNKAPLTEEQRKLFDKNMGFAEAIAEKRINRHVDIEDRTQAAYGGLLDAVRGFEPERGGSFRSYAYGRIWGAIRDAERLPGNMMIHHTRSSRAKGNPEPKTVLSGAFDRAGDEGRGLDGSTYLFVDPMADPSVEVEARDAIEAAFGCLLENERRIVRAYWLEGKTMKAVGAEIGSSESRVSQVMPGIIDRLREHSALADYAKGA